MKSELNQMIKLLLYKDRVMMCIDSLYPYSDPRFGKANAPSVLA